MSVNAVWTVLAMTAVMVLINNSCYSTVRGTVNGWRFISFSNVHSMCFFAGIAQTLASLARFIGPTLGGFVFAWSQSNALPWPFDRRFLWSILTLLVVVVLLESS